MADVAKHAGVSISSASQALRGVGRLSKKTRSKILKSAETLKFQPNKRAVGLRAGSSNEIGLLIHDIANPFNAEMAAGITSVIEDTGNLLYLLDANEDSERQHKLILSVVQNSAAGIIWCPARNTPIETIELLQSSKLNVVTVLRPLLDAKFDHVGVDDFHGSQDAVNHLVKLGHINIGFLGGDPAFKSSKQLGGFVAGLYQAGIKAQDDHWYSCEPNIAEAMNAMIKFHKKKPNMTAVVCYNDTVAFGANFALSRLGIEVGKEFAVVGCDNITEAELFQPPLSTVAVSPSRIGAEAARLLATRNLSPKEEPRSVIFPTGFIARASSDFSLK